MPYIQHFFVGKRYYGKVVREAALFRGYLQAPRGLAFFCTGCGEIWARFPVEGEEWHGVPAHFPCQSCAPGRTIFGPGGSILCDFWDERLLEHLPFELLKREFLLWLNLYKEES